MTPRKYEDVKEGFENMEDRLEIKRRSWEVSVTQNGKMESQVGS